MNYVKVILRALAAIFLAWVVVFGYFLVRASANRRAIGSGVLAGVTASPVLWILAVLFLVLSVRSKGMRS
jgi:hypothetical protein